jgi:hypothetical protein
MLAVQLSQNGKRRSPSSCAEDRPSCNVSSLLPAIVFAGSESWSDDDGSGSKKRRLWWPAPPPTIRAIDLAWDLRFGSCFCDYMPAPVRRLVVDYCNEPEPCFNPETVVGGVLERALHPQILFGYYPGRATAFSLLPIGATGPTIVLRIASADVWNVGFFRPADRAWFLIWSDGHISSSRPENVHPSNVAGPDFCQQHPWCRCNECDPSFRLRGWFRSSLVSHDTIHLNCNFETGRVRCHCISGVDPSHDKLDHDVFCNINDLRDCLLAIGIEGSQAPARHNLNLNFPSAQLLALNSLASKSLASLLTTAY